jgi:hypothetical protein
MALHLSVPEAAAELLRRRELRRSLVEWAKCEPIRIHRGETRATENGAPLPG